MSNKLKIGVVGAGVFGGYHANKCAEHPRTEFIGIYDSDTVRAKAGAAKHDVEAFETYEAMLADTEAVVIACPAKFHGQMAIQALEAGKHCLIEKPIAAMLSEAERIVALANEKPLIVQVGHQERFVAKAIGLDRISEHPQCITACRMGKFSDRGTDVSVTLDLMTHDIDLVLMLMDEMPDSVSGQSIRVKSNTPDAARAEFGFGEAKAVLEASRAEDEFRRMMDIIYPSGTVRIDFNAKTLTHNSPFDLSPDFGNDPVAKDSLGAASNAFIEAVLDGKPVPITALDGYNALKLALIIDGEA